jgi:hypothetical protein
LTKRDLTEQHILFVGSFNRKFVVSKQVKYHDRFAIIKIGHSTHSMSKNIALPIIIRKKKIYY